jgi:hypothetical protein
LVNRLGSEEVAQHVIAWPSDLIIEVRVCARCCRMVSHVTDDVRGRPSGAAEERER